MSPLPRRKTGVTVPPLGEGLRGFEMMQLKHLLVPGPSGGTCTDPELILPRGALDEAVLAELY